MSPQYKHSPIVEAICEFQFKADQEWDWTIPGLMYDKVKEGFKKKRQANLVEMGVEVSGQQVAHQIKGGVARMQFLREDELAMLQVGPNMLAVNQLKPYPNWPQFQQMIANALLNYQQVTAPLGFIRIGLRYINRIETKLSQINIEEYLFSQPTAPEPIPQSFASWFQRIDVPFESENGVLRLQSGSIHDPAIDEVQLLLDLDFATLQPESITLNDAMKWVETAHSKIELAFEASITDKARELFNQN